MKKIALITGATSGIGAATALLLAQNGFNLIITGRRQEQLNILTEKLKAECAVEVHALCFDIRKLSAVNQAIDSLPDEWKNIDVLVNNAGLAAGLDPIQGGNIDDWEQMLDTNVKGLLYISRKVLPTMVQRASGHVVNIGSIAGKEVYPNGNVYCASKFAVDALSKSMRIDLVKHGIRVTQISPGMVETEFSMVRFKGNSEAAKRVYTGLTPLSANDVADTVLYAVTRPNHVNINEIVLTPVAQASTTIVERK